MTIATWLSEAHTTLQNAGITSAHLDAEIILTHTLKKPRTWVHAHSDDEIEPRLLEIANARLDLRTDRTPIAYIIGHKEFYGRLFHVSPAVLIPRPESEAIIESVKLWRTPEQTAILDVGTGSGCLAITLALELPGCTVAASDISQPALIVAKRNAIVLNAEVALYRSDLLSTVPGHYDIIVANLPYVDIGWEDNSPELAAEPAEALYADNHGLTLIYKLLSQATRNLTDHGLLVLESDIRQHGAITQVANAKYQLVDTRGLCLTFRKR